MGKNNYNLAILVGINAYENGIPSLKTPVNDVAGLAEVLKSSYQYDVKQLLDSEATLEGLNRLLDNLKEGILTLSDHRVVKVESYNRFLFYFAGHGIVDDAFENQDGPAGYLIPQDGQKSNKSTFLAMQQLHDVLVELKCRHLLVILDCCFAGAFRFLRNLVPYQKLYRERYDRFMKGKAQQMIASAAYDEKALDVLTRSRLGQREDKNTGKHSPFAKVLLKALQIETDQAKAPADIIPDGVITASELYIYLEKELAEVTDRQTPGLYPLKHHEKGEYVFQIPGFLPDKLEKAPPLDEKSNPYRGLEPYEAENSELFFGREQVIRDLVNHVSDATKPPLTVVLGVSGSGKSSLVKAGLIPRLLKEEKEHWQILTPIRPQSLVKALFPDSKNQATDNQQQIDEKLQLTPQILLKKLEVYQNHSTKKLLLIIDQFEELITQSSQEEKRKLLDSLKQLLNNHSREIQVVITLRSEFESQFASEFVNSGKEVVLFAIIFLAIEELYKFIPILSKSYQNVAQKRWMAARFVVPTMTQDEFREVIEKPAIEKVLYFEPPKLVDKLINEVLGMPGALPLLSFTLSELYLKYLERRSDNRAMTQEDYEALGGVMGSLKTSATRVYNQLVQKNSSYEQTIRHVMLRMVAVGGGELARRAVPKSELRYPELEENERVNTVIDCFLKARLLVSGTDAQGKVYYEPAHDALILGWDTLLEWRQNKKEQENLLLQRQLTPAVEDWKEIDHSRNKKVEPLVNLVDQGLDFIYNSLKFVTTHLPRLFKGNLKDKNHQKYKFLWDSNPRLNLLEEVLNSGDNWLSDTEAEFVESSIKQSRRNVARGWSITFGVFLGLSWLTITVLIGLKEAKVNEAKTARQASLVALNADQQLEAVVEALRGGKIIQSHWLLKFWQPTQQTRSQIRGTFWEAVYQTLEQNRLLHPSEVKSAEFSPNGQRILTTTEDGRVKLWNRYGKEIITLKGHQNRIWKSQFSPDSQKIVTASFDRTAKLWDLSGKEIATLKGHRDEVLSAQFSPDSQKIVTASLDGTAKLWDLSGKEIATLKGHKSQVYSAQFSPNNQRIVTTSEDRTAKIWDRDGKEIATLKGHRDLVGMSEFSPDCQNIVTASKDGTAKLWDWDGKEIVTLKGHQHAVRSAEFSPNSKRIVTASFDGTARLWDLSGKEIAILKGDQSPIYSAKFSPDGKWIITASGDGTVQLWDQEAKRIVNLKGHQDEVLSAQFSPDGNWIITASGDGTVRLWDWEHKENTTLKDKNSTVREALFSPDSSRILTVSKDAVQLWDLSGKEVTTLKGHQFWVFNAQFSPNGLQIVTASQDGTARLWDLSGKEIAILRSHRKAVRGAQFSANGKRIVTFSEDGTAKLWNQDGQEIITLKGHNSPLWSSQFSPDCQHIVTASEDGKVKLWNWNGKEIRTFKSYYNSVTQAQFSSNSQYILTTSSGIAQLWNLNGKMLTTFRGYIYEIGQYENNLYSAQFSPNSQWIVTSFKDGTAKLWDLSGKEIATLKGHQSTVYRVKFSPNSQWIATASEDGTTKLWDLSGRNIATLKGHKKGVLRVEFSSNSKRIITVSKDGTAKVWLFSSIPELMKKACFRISGYLKHNPNVDLLYQKLCDRIPKST